MMTKPEQQQFFQEIIEQHKGILFKVARRLAQSRATEEDEITGKQLISEIVIKLSKRYR